VVCGIAEGCRQAGAALIGGETAEMAGFYQHGEYDLAGFSVGAVRRSEILPRGVAEGDVLIALPSSGVHSNGYSLVRKCVERSGLGWGDPCPFEAGPVTLAEALLRPTKIYVKQLLPLVKKGWVKGMAHITGGGLLDNLPRVLPQDLCAEVHLLEARWLLPPVFKWLQDQARLPQEEMLRTFNCGVGMVLVVGADLVDLVLEEVTKTGENDASPMVLGKLIKRAEPDMAQVKIIGVFPDA
jgi:phosphoribosylaminoimidazole synthetase